MAAGDPMYAERKADKANPKKGAVESVNIKKAENGFIVRCSHPPRETSGKNTGPQWVPDTEYAFSTFDEARAFVDKALGGVAQS